MTPLYQYADHDPPLAISVESTGPRSKKAISIGCSGIGPVEHRDAALIPRLHHDVATRNRDQRAVVRHAVLLRRLRRRQLVVALELHLAGSRS